MVLLLSLILNGALVFYVLRPQPASIKIIPAPQPTAVPATVHVFVSGAVVRPEVYELPVGSLVKDALRAAGGQTSDAEMGQVNLARKVRDEEQIVIPFRQAAPGVAGAAGPASAIVPSGLMPAGPAAGSATVDASRGKINLNTATADELELLPEIGPALAQGIVEYRGANGPFRSTAALKEVHGIGDAIYERVKDQVTVD